MQTEEQKNIPKNEQEKIKSVYSIITDSFIYLFFLLSITCVYAQYLLIALSSVYTGCFCAYLPLSLSLCVWVCLLYIIIAE